MSGAIFARRGMNDIHTLADLRGHKVLVHAGSLGEQVLRSAGLSNSIVIIASVDEAFRQLESGHGDATLAGRLTGLMTVYSRPDEGSVFRLYLPAVSREATRIIDPQDSAPPRGRGECVIFVDDEEAIARIAGRLSQRLERFNKICSHRRQTTRGCLGR